MNIYLAAPWQCRAYAKVAANKFVMAGHDITSRWLDIEEDTHDSTLLAIEAQNDLDDIQRSDVLVVLNLQKSEGKAVEQGVALTLKLPIIVVSAVPEFTWLNVFQHLPHVHHVLTVEDAIQRLEVLLPQ